MNTEKSHIIIGGCWLEDVFRLLLEFPECDIEVRRSIDNYHYEVVLKRKLEKRRQVVELSRDAAKDLILMPKLFDKILEKADIVTDGGK